MAAGRCVLILCGVSVFASGAAAQAADPGAQASAGDYSDGDIIVTAQRREESVTKVPLSITALTGAQIQGAGVNDTLALTKMAPGLVMDRIGGFTLPAIRGVSTQVTAAGGDANIAIYVDGVYQPSSTTNTFDLPDVERIEVLKGPQGTLFGRNATGGAIRIVTKKPQYNLGGSFTASYGSFNDTLIKGFASLPIVDQKVALGIAASYQRNDGYLHDIVQNKRVGGLKSSLIRGKLRLDPSDNIRVMLNAYYANRSDPTSVYGFPQNGNTVAKLFPGSVISTGPYQVAVNPTTADGQIVNTAKTQSYSAQVEFDVGAGTVSSLTAYSKNEAHINLQPAAAYTPGFVGVFYDGFSTDKQFSEELTFSSHLDGRINFTAGLFYVDGWGGWTPLNVLTDKVKVGIHGRQTIKALAGFGEIFFDVTDKLHLIAGARYSYEKRSEHFKATAPYKDAETLPFVGERSWNSFTPRFSMRYDIIDSTNVYFTYSRGFKSGIFNPSQGVQPDGSLPLANPETVEAFEVGAKGRPMDWLDFSLALFHYNYSGLQVVSFQCVPVGDPNCLPFSLLQNAAKAKIDGAEISANLSLTKSFRVQTGVSLLNGRFTSFPGATIAVPKTDAKGIPTGTGNVSTPVDVTGNPLLRAPKFTISVTPTFRTEVAGGKLELSSTLYHSSRIYYTYDKRISQKPYTLIDARASWTPRSLPLTFAVFGRNLTGVERIQGTLISEVSDHTSYAAPSTWGLEVTADF